MRQRVWTLAVFVTVFSLFAASYGAFNRTSYGLGAIYLACVTLYLIVWRVSLTAVIKRDRWILIAGSQSLLLAFFDYWQLGNVFLQYVYLGAAVFNLLPVFLPRRIKA